MARDPLDKEENGKELGERVVEDDGGKQTKDGGREEGGRTRYCRCQDAGCVSSRTTGEKYCDDGIRLYFIPLSPPPRYGQP